MPDPVLGGRKVLAVDDEADFLEFVGDILRGQALVVLKARTGAEALDILRREPDVALVLLDVVLENESGLDVCRAMKRDERLRNIPVMFVTGHAATSHIAELLDAGAEEFSIKPFRAEEFVVRVWAMLRLRAAREAEALRTKDAESLASSRTAELDAMRVFAEGALASLTSGVALTDADGVILFANDAFRRITGAPANAAAGRPAITGVLGEALSAQVSLRERISAAAGGAHEFEAREVFLRSGSRPERVLDMKIRPISYAGARRALVVVDDVTDRWLAREAIRVEAERLAGAVDAMGAALARVGRDERALWTNATFRQWFGNPGGLRLRDALGLPDDEPTRAILAESFGHATAGRIRWARAAADGAQRHYETTLAPIGKGAAAAAGTATPPAPSEVLALTFDITPLATRVEQLSLLRQLGTVIQGAHDLDTLLALVLTCVTAGHALEFNRAFLFLVDREASRLQGRMGVGPANREDAFRIWAELSSRRVSFAELVTGLQRRNVAFAELPLARLAASKSYPLTDSSEILVRAVSEKKPLVVRDAANDPRVTADFRRTFEAGEFAVIPLVSKDEVAGVILADNLYNGRPITQQHIESLDMFGQQAAMAILNAAAYSDLQEKMQTIREQAEQIVRSEKLATIGRLATHVAHEIRNPLVTIGGFARAVARHPERIQRSRSNALIITEEVSRLEQMLAGVMDFTKPAKPNMAPTDLNRVISSAAEALAMRLDERSVGVELALDASLPQIDADEKQLRQILLNLVNNAVDAMPSGGKVTLRSSHDEDSVRMAVEDTGLGIPDEIMPRLFHPFFTTKAGGTGLGLAVTQKIAEDHGGTVEVQSEVGYGTTFTLTFPVRRTGERRGRDRSAEVKTARDGGKGSDVRAPFA